MCSLGWGVPGRPVRGCDWEPGKNRAGKRREGGVQTELQTGGGGGEGGRRARETETRVVFAIALSSDDAPAPPKQGGGPLTLGHKSF